jgi:hypothetical protein
MRYNFIYEETGNICVIRVVGLLRHGTSRFIFIVFFVIIIIISILNNYCLVETYTIQFGTTNYFIKMLIFISIIVYLWYNIF